MTLYICWTWLFDCRTRLTQLVCIVFLWPVPWSLYFSTSKKLGFNFKKKLPHICLSQIHGSIVTAMKTNQPITIERNDFSQRLKQWSREPAVFYYQKLEAIAVKKAEVSPHRNKQALTVNILTDVIFLFKPQTETTSRIRKTFSLQ